MVPSFRPERRPKRFRAALVLGMCLLGSLAGATTMFRADVPTLSRSADAIVRGRVQSKQSHWTGDKRRIVTDVQIEVQEVLKGTPPRVVTVRQPGGQVGELGQAVSGIASFRPGEEVLVFLERSGPVSRLAGMAQGKFHLDPTASGDLRATPESTGDAEVIDRTTRAPLTPSRAPSSYASLKAQIAQALRAAPSAR